MNEGSEHDQSEAPTEMHYQHAEEETFIVECVIVGVNLLIPFPLSASVEDIAGKAHAEYQLLNPRAPPMKIQ